LSQDNFLSANLIQKRLLINVKSVSELNRSREKGFFGGVYVGEDMLILTDMRLNFVLGKGQRMIEQRKFYIAKCDGKDGKCGYIIDWDFKHDYFLVKQDLIIVLVQDDWQRKGSKWLCPDCQGEK